MLSRSVLDALTPITEEERAILNSSSDIDRSLYMDGSRDVEMHQNPDREG